MDGRKTNFKCRIPTFERIPTNERFIYGCVCPLVSREGGVNALPRGLGLVFVYSVLCIVHLKTNIESIDFSYRN
jgi:hypothetical protein